LLLISGMIINYNTIGSKDCYQ